MSQADDLLDPFPMTDGHRRAMQLQQRLEQEREHELKAILRRIATHQQSLDDVRRLAVELGIPMTIHRPHTQD